MGRAAFVRIMLLGLVTSAVADDRAKGNAASEANSAVEAPKEATAPSMQPGHVAMLSNAFAAKRIGAFDYRVTRIVYENEPGSRLWTIHYVLGPAPDGRKPDPDVFEVLVDDRTGAARFPDR